MQRDVIKPVFVRSQKQGSILPSVVVLPKIGADRNDSERCKDQNRNDFDDQSLTQKPFLDGKRAAKSVFQPITTEDGDYVTEKTITAFPPLSAKPPSLVKKRFNKREKIEARSYPPLKDRFKSITAPSQHHGQKQRIPFDEEGNSFEESDQTIQSESRSTLDDLNTFEDPNSRDMWHYNKPPMLSRRESVCSSCGGALSYSNSFASTRRFSAVSIEVPNENLMKKSFISRHAPSITEDSIKIDSSETRSRRKNDNQEENKNKKNTKAIDTVEFSKLEKQRNLLYDLISVLYKKDFVKDEIRPYVRHALDLCSKDISKKS